MALVGTIVLWGSAVYHLLVGALSLVTVAWVRKVGRALYGLDIPENLDPRYEYVWKPLGAYAIFTGLVSLYAALPVGAPSRNFVIHVLALLFALRAFSRLIYRDLFERAFNVPFRRNLVNIVFNALLVVVMLICARGTPG